MASRIIALSDSHASTTRALPPPLRDALRTANIIVHAGDHTETSLLEELQQMAEVFAVAGNMDSTALKVRLPPRQLFTASGVTIGLVHGSGPPAGIEQRVRALFPENPDLIIFGHSHVPFQGAVDGVLLLNPGPAKSSYAVVTLDKGIAAELVTIR